MGIADRDLASGIPSPLATGALAEKPGVPQHTFFVHIPFLQASLQRVYKQKTGRFSSSGFSAEREGFEPPDPLRSTVFKTAAIDHSATSPNPCFRFGIANVRIKFLFANFNAVFF